MAKVLTVVNEEQCIGCQACVFACARLVRRKGLPMAISIDQAAIRVRTVDPIGSRMRVVTCIGCLDAACARVCPTNALTQCKGGGVRFDPSKCVSCGNCMRACIVGALRAEDSTNKPIVCIHCGRCANYCPHGVLALRNTEEVLEVKL